MSRFGRFTDDEQAAIEMALDITIERTSRNLLKRIEDGTKHNTIAWAARNLGTLGRLALEALNTSASAPRGRFL
jgi:hypothetical protein